MASHSYEQDRAQLLRKLQAMERTELAQCLAQVVDGMVADSIPDEVVRDMCGEIHQELGVTAEEVRGALH